MRSVAALITAGMASLIAGCSTVPLWQAASLQGKPIGEVVARYGQPNSAPPTMPDYTWTQTDSASGACSMHVSTDRAGLVASVIMNGDSAACKKLRRPKLAETRLTDKHMTMSLPAAFHLDDSEHVFVKVSVNSQPSVWMLVDTGSTPSAINFEYAKSIGLKYDQVNQSGAGAGSDPINIRHTVVSSLQSGALVEHQIPFVTVEYSRSGPDGKPIAGVLGYSFLRGHTLVLDYRRSIVSISKRRLPRQSSVPFVLTNDIPTVQVSLNKRMMSALLDTGGGYQILLTPEAANRIGLQPSKSDARQTSGVGYGGTQMLTLSTGPAFSVGEVTKPTSDITYMPLPIEVDGAIGTHLFKDYKVEVDYQSKLVRFSE